MRGGANHALSLFHQIRNGNFISPAIRFVIIVFGMRKSEIQMPVKKNLVRHILRIICFGFQVMLMPVVIHAADSVSLQVSPPGKWVKPQFFSQQASAGLLDAGSDERILLLERQINARENEIFFHSMRQILTVSGVQKEANLTINFNPGYQNLTFHWVRLWRGSEHLDRLDTNQVKVVQPEREMDDYILNGKKSAILVLDDVRVGDVLDYAYSVKGENPVFTGHFSAEVPVQLGQPAERLFTRVLWPNGRRLYAKTHGCTVQPKIISGADTVEYTWDLRQIPGITLEDSVPSWYDPEPWVQLSDFKTWAEVNQWALELFKTSGPLSPELTRQIAAWKQLPDRESQIMAALRFVQDDVRYFGIEIGSSTVKPGDPSTVFSRRFGDCKDKSLLFVTILRALGIEAYPVLVNSTLCRGIVDWQPTDGAFDHCIAVARCDGQTYWLDPTMSYQRGSLAAHYLPAYDYGLVIAPYTTALTAIPHNTGPPQTTISEYFLLRGANQPADLKVVTVAQGRDAEGLRELFASKKRSDLEKSYTRSYASLYPGIRMTSSIAIEDDIAQNKVQTVELYSIDNIWAPPDKTGRYSCEFYASRIADMLRKPADTDRKFPLGIDYPAHLFLHTEVTLPQPWPAGSEKKTVNDPAFSFRKAALASGNRLIMEYDYNSLADWVSPERVSQYIQRLNEASQSLGYTLTSR